MITGMCKAKNLKREITFRWLGIGQEWELDETDTELLSLN